MGLEKAIKFFAPLTLLVATTYATISLYRRNGENNAENYVQRIQEAGL